MMSPTAFAALVAITLFGAAVDQVVISNRTDGCPSARKAAATLVTAAHTPVVAAR